MTADKTIYDNIIYATFGGDRASDEWEREQAAKRLQELQQESGMSGELLKAAFPTNLDQPGLPDGYAETAYRLMKFAQNWKAVKAGGFGAYIHGDVGTGKTYLAACLANSLMARGVRVKFATMAKISMEIKATYGNASNGTEYEVMKTLLLKELLIIDDLGTESLSRNDGDNFLQDKIFELIDGRWLNKKPTVFTSNYGLPTLMSRRMMVKTIDRVAGMTKGGVMEIKGKSFRGCDETPETAKTPF